MKILLGIVFGVIISLLIGVGIVSEIGHQIGSNRIAQCEPLQILLPEDPNFGFQKKMLDSMKDVKRASDRGDKQSMREGLARARIYAKNGNLDTCGIDATEEIMNFFDEARRLAGN